MPEELQVIDHATQELARFDQIEAAIAEIKTEAAAITVTDHTDKHGATQAHNLRLTIKPIRIQADKLRQEIKAPLLKLCDQIEKKGQSIIKPLDAIERELKAKEEIVSKHAEREAEKERQRIAAEQEAARKQLEADQAKLAAERAEVERMRAEIERASAANLAHGSADAATESEYITIKAVFEASSDYLRDMGNAHFLKDDALERFTSANQISVELTVRRATGAVVGVHTSSASIL